MILTGQQYLQRRSFLECGTDQQPQIDQRITTEQMRFVEDQQQCPFDSSARSMI